MALDRYQITGANNAVFGDAVLLGVNFTVLEFLRTFLGNDILNANFRNVTGDNIDLGVSVNTLHGQDLSFNIGDDVYTVQFI